MPLTKINLPVLFNLMSQNLRFMLVQYKAQMQLNG